MKDKINIPNYHHITWSMVTPGQMVWLQGRALGKPKAYGPFRVESSKRRELMNVKGNKFMHYAEDLVLPDWR